MVPFCGGWSRGRIWCSEIAEKLMSITLRITYFGILEQGPHGDPGIVDEDVDTSPKEFDGRFDEAATVVFVADVGDHGMEG